MSWEANHQRNRIITSILHDMYQHDAAAIPGRWYGPIEVFFENEEKFLLTLHNRWLLQLVYYVEESLEHGATDLDSMVHIACLRIAAESPELHHVLAAYATHPAVAEARENDHILGSLATRPSLLTSSMAG